MRYFRKIIWPVLAFDLLLLAFVVVPFRMALYYSDNLMKT